MPGDVVPPDELLTTTRAVRRRLDFERPVDLELVQECLDVAVHAPTGSNEQGWHFVVVTDEATRLQIAELYRRAWDSYRNSDGFAAFRLHADDPQMAATQQRMVDSTAYLAENLHRVPVFVIPCVNGRPDQAQGPLAVVTQASVYGSIIPAAWSFMLAARARGLGTVWTTLHLFHERAVADLLGIPYDEVTQVALIPVGHVIGDPFKPPPRRSVERAVHMDRW